MEADQKINSVGNPTLCKGKKRCRATAETWLSPRNQYLSVSPKKGNVPTAEAAA
ncbi:hypothetical protein [Rickettsiella massiliensis]|uniref:hypothetical protein n=1 Tax=Rickettsiella massiliensis TaxID=676517 RepID=UPI0012EA0E2E|nr:hypothetical protein [Rickettsiella massiliensis]